MKLPRAPRRRQIEVDEARHQANLLREQLREARNQRDKARRLFNRLDAAITHHRRDSGIFTDTHDDALYAAHARVLRDSAKKGTA